MSKVNKVFLALTIALLITTVLELGFIFIYKQPQPNQALPTSVVVTPTPIHTMPMAVSSNMIQQLQAWPTFRNANLTLIETITGTINSFSKQTQAPNPGSYLIVLNGTHGVDTTQFVIPPNILPTLKVFYLDTKTGDKKTADLSSLKAGQNINIISNIDLHSGSQMALEIDIQQ